ncbi:MAG: type II toxin-antitoxin system VapC family toxin [Roseiflexaceae bacterium]
MSNVLLDTNIVSFVFKRDTRAAGYAPLLQGNRLAISFMTTAELFQWAFARHWGQPRFAQLEQAITDYLIIPPDLDLCRVWGQLRAERQAIGQTIDAQDAWIAATALHYALPLVTHNASHFQSIPGLVVRTVATP